MHDDLEAAADSAAAAADVAHADAVGSQQQQQQQHTTTDASLNDAAAPAAAAAAVDQVVIELGPLASHTATSHAAVANAAAAAAPAAFSSGSPTWKISTKPSQTATAAAGDHPAGNAAPDTGLSHPHSSSTQQPLAGKDATKDASAVAAAAAGDVSTGKDVLAKTSAGVALQRTSVYGLTGAVPVGVITLEDVLEELMQVG
jgi:hypothetical protein